MEKKRIRRLIRFVEEMKKKRYPNAPRFAALLHKLDLTENEDLAVSAKTVQRDIIYLQKDLEAPIDYCPQSRGYYLIDENWGLPYLRLQEDDLFSAFFCNRVSEPFLPSPIQSGMDEVTSIQLAAGEAGSLNLVALESLVVATGRTVPLNPEVAKIVLEAWREAQTLHILYGRGSDNARSERDIDIHAIFLSEGAWYVRAWCHLRNTYRSFAMHRIAAATATNRPFERSAAVAQEVRSGRVFDYEPLRHVRLLCRADKARYFRERQWFPGQVITERPDGALEVYYEAVPDPLFTQWIMGFMGAVIVLEPAELRARILATAQEMASSHLPR